jgi:nucleoid DNA-binding protein
LRHSPEVKAGETEQVSVTTNADLVTRVSKEQMQAALSRGERITLVGFGTFAVRWRAARTGRHPRTGQEVVIAARKIPTFRAGQRLREAVRQGVSPTATKASEPLIPSS